MRRLSSGYILVVVDTGIGFGAKVVVTVGKTLFGSKVGKAMTGGGVNVAIGDSVSVAGACVVIGVSVAGGVTCPQAVRSETKIIRMYRGFIVIGISTPAKRRRVFYA